MEKLIELLNEYDVGVVSREKREYSEITGDMIRGISDDQERLSMADICSKKFGFIKWLVDNEKIDFRKLDCKRYDVDIPARYYLGTYIRYSIEKEMLMTLAIQDEPIKFLTSLLKNV